jgi:hypothetical protein
MRYTILFAVAFEQEAVNIDVQISLDAFEAIRSQAAHPHSGMMGATVTLVGNGLPESSFILLKDLDVSAQRTYAVGSFEITCAEGQPPRPLPVEGYGGANISILLTGDGSLRGNSSLRPCA